MNKIKFDTLFVNRAQNKRNESCTLQCTGRFQIAIKC